MPDWLVTRSLDEYVEATIRLIENFSERDAISRDLLARDPDSVLFAGDPRVFAEVVDWVRTTRPVEGFDKVVRLPQGKL
jgi:hypothetical protein